MKPEARGFPTAADHQRLSSRTAGSNPIAVFSAHPELTVISSASPSTEIRYTRAKLAKETMSDPEFLKRMSIQAENESVSRDSVAVEAEDLSVKYLIRYHRAEVTLRETLIRAIRPGYHRWRQAFWALSEVSFNAKKGEVLGLIGRNGSGKSTLLKALAGIVGIDRGQVKIQGRIGCLLSFGAGFNPSLTGRENIFLSASMLGISSEIIKERLDDIIEISEVDEFINAPVRTYSAGMRVRLGFAIAAQIKPDVLLLDEMLTAGDAGFRERTGGMIENLAENDRTIVVASHSIGMLRQICTRVIWLDEGRIRMEGGPSEVTGAYIDDARRHNQELASVNS